MKKTTATKAKEIKRRWHLIDLEGKILGRVASRIAPLLIGKNKPYFTSHLDCGDYVVLINASKLKVSGLKAKNKKYYRHSGFPGGFKEISWQEQMEKDPRKVILHAVSGMLPKNKLRDPRLKRLKIFAGANHPYQDKFIQKEKGKKDA